MNVKYIQRIIFSFLQLVYNIGIWHHNSASHNFVLM